MSKTIDENGFVTYLDTFITGEGVFDYAGFQIDFDGSMGLDPKSVYKVYRPKSEVVNKDFVLSLNNKPLVNDHTLVGDIEGAKPVEKKGAHGVVSNAHVKGDGVYADVTVWSGMLKDLIARGKKELSLAYPCRYRKEHGMFKGEEYDFVQFGLGCSNHLALVDEARMGHKCRVMDCAYACDSLSLELDQMPDEDKKKLTADELIEGIKGCSDDERKAVMDACGFADKPAEDTADKPEDKPEEEKPAEDKAEDAPAEDAKPEEGDEPKKEEEDKPAEDAADKPEDKPCEDKADEDKAMDALVEEKVKAAMDCAVKELQKAYALAEECKQKYGKIAMDGLLTEKDVAVKVCAMDAALKDVDADNAVAVLRYALKTSHNVAQDASVKVTKGMSFADFINK